MSRLAAGHVREVAGGADTVISLEETAQKYMDGFVKKRALTRGRKRGRMLTEQQFWHEFRQAILRLAREPGHERDALECIARLIAARLDGCSDTAVGQKPDPS